MPRNLSVAMITALNEPMNIRFFFECEFLSSTLRLCSGITDISWDSQTWLGNGYLVGVGDFSNSVDLSANQMTIQLQAASSLISTLLSDIKHGGAGKFWLGLLDSNGAVITDPVLLFSGELDTANANIGEQSGYLAINFYSSMVIAKRKKEIRLNHQAQQNRYSGDKGFEFVEGLSGKKIFWGRSGEGVP